jgi:fermentation-respiration switch protein FrsA (DUF1100 family)
MAGSNARRAGAAAALVAAALLTWGTGGSVPARAETVGPRSASATLVIRGVPQVLRLYGSPGGPPAVVTSGDGGWIHLAPHVAQTLAAHGWYVVGVDARAYLSGFTRVRGGVRPEEVPADYRELVAFAAAAGGTPVLVGVSEGAGLSVLAASSPVLKPLVAGVVALGLGDRNELAWHWRDALIYLTRQTPAEPTFSAAEVVGGLAPLPLAAIHATHDDFVPLDEVERVLARARAPKRLWIIEAADHRFSDRLADFDGRLLEALAWVRANQPTVRQRRRANPRRTGRAHARRAGLAFDRQSRR